MKQKILPAGTAGFLILACLPALLPAGTLPKLGKWLRALSLSGGWGNAAAWAVVLGLTALPALGLQWRPRCRWDWLLPLAAAEIFAGLYLLVNPSLVSDQFPAGDFIALAAAGTISATVLAWAILRWLAKMENSRSLGQTLERLLKWSALLIGWLAAWSEGAAALEKLHAVAAGNTAPAAALWPTNAAVILLAIADYIPILLGCAMLLWSGKLARLLETEPFGGETVAMAEKISRGCGRVAAASLLVCVGGNLAQMLLLPMLHNADFSVSFPLLTVLLAAALDLLCRYLRRAKEVNDDNESIIRGGRHGYHRTFRRDAEGPEYDRKGAVCQNGHHGGEFIHSPLRQSQRRAVPHDQQDLLLPGLRRRRYSALRRETGGRT